MNHSRRKDGLGVAAVSLGGVTVVTVEGALRRFGPSGWKGSRRSKPLENAVPFASPQPVNSRHLGAALSQAATRTRGWTYGFAGRWIVYGIRCSSRRSNTRLSAPMVLERELAAKCQWAPLMLAPLDQPGVLR